MINMKILDFVTGVCPSTVECEIKDGKIYNLKFDKGCHGNSQFISRLVEGRTIEEIISIAKGIECGKKGTSCGDQLARILESRIK